MISTRECAQGERSSQPPGEGQLVLGPMLQGLVDRLCPRGQKMETEARSLRMGFGERVTRQDRAFARWVE